MKQLIPFFLFIFLSFQIEAQGELVVEPNPYVERFVVDLNASASQATTHGIFINTSMETVEVKWELNVEYANCPRNWEFQVSDNNNRYIHGVYSNKGTPVNVPITLAPGDSSLLELQIKPNGKSGCCKPFIQLSKFESPNTIYTSQDFDICVESATAVTQREKANLRIFPNPATRYISLSDNTFVKKLWVSNILGKRVKSFTTAVTNNYDITDLPDGIYLVSMVDEFNKVLKTVRISKRNIRP